MPLAVAAGVSCPHNHHNLGSPPTATTTPTPTAVAIGSVRRPAPKDVVLTGSGDHGGMELNAAYRRLRSDAMEQAREPRYADNVVVEPY